MKIKPFCRKANFYETDQMGIIHHSNYIRWFEESRVDFMEKIDFDYRKVNERGIDFGVIDVYCEYKSMVRFSDIVNIKVTLSEVTEMRLTVDYEITNAKTGELCTLGRSKHFYYDTKKQRPVSLKRGIPELFELFCSLKT